MKLYLPSFSNMLLLTFLSVVLVGCERHASFLKEGSIYEAWSATPASGDTGYKRFTVIKQEGDGWYQVRSKADPYWLNISGYEIIRSDKNDQSTTTKQ
jgi:hypothetical protein